MHYLTNRAKDTQWVYFTANLKLDLCAYQYIEYKKKYIEYDHAMHRYYSNQELGTVRVLCFVGLGGG